MSGEDKSVDPEVFRKDVIRPALKAIGRHSPEAEELLLGTAIQESQIKYTRQLANRDGTRGPALGYFQMEPATYKDIWGNFLKYRADLASKVLSVAGLKSGTPDVKLLRTNHLFAAAMARVHYMRNKDPLPNSGDLKAQSKYWKKFYNTAKGKGKSEEYVENYKKAMKKK